MENKAENQAFKFTYSAKQQEEIKNIRKKYIPVEEDKMTLLKKMDKQVYQKATIIALIFGIIGTLIMGFGISCVMVWKDTLFIQGIIIGIAGIAVLSVAYPLYNKTLQKEREKIAPEIIRLTDELMR